jgi:hypothetical protein
MKSEPLVLEEDYLSVAWAKGQLSLLEPGVREISPLVVTINLSEGEPVETPEIRRLIEANLARSWGKKKMPLQPCEATASTIFPVLSGCLRQVRTPSSPATRLC